MTTQSPRPTISRIPKTASPELITHTTDLINTAYLAGESDFWLPGWQRTTEAGVTKLIMAGQLIGAYINDRLVGCIKSEQLDSETHGLGMMAVESVQQGTGLGRQLFQFVEDEGREAGAKRMQVELLMPKEWVKPSKELLWAWYLRRGYEETGRCEIEEMIPELRGLLKTPCDLIIMKKTFSRAKDQCLTLTLDETVQMVG